MIKALRVDHRLLHGQVAFSWTSHLGADCILLASDSLLNDELRLTTVKIARDCPAAGNTSGSKDGRRFN